MNNRQVLQLSVTLTSPSKSKKTWKIIGSAVRTSRPNLGRIKYVARGCYVGGALNFAAEELDRNLKRKDLALSVLRKVSTGAKRG
jgi:hypothetical protein